MSADTQVSIYDFTDTNTGAKSLKIGKDFKHPFQWGTDYDATATPPFTSVKDITGFAFLMEVRQKKSDILPVIVFSTSDSSIVLTDATNGKFQLVKTDIQTTGLTEGTYCYDLQYTDLASEKFILFSGVFEIASTVTK